MNLRSNLRPDQPFVVPHRLFTALLLAGLLIAPAAMADHHMEEAAADAMHGDAMGEALVGMFDRTTGKLKQLSGAIPAEHFDWRPAEGVYSVSEAMMHIAGANFALANALGVPRPENLPDDMAAVTNKGEVTAWLETSIDVARGALEEVTPEDAGETVNAFGQEMTRAVVAMIILDHNAEHLGQLIAYGRSNGVVPPWSQAAAAASADGDDDDDGADGGADESR